MKKPNPALSRGIEKLIYFLLMLIMFLLFVVVAQNQENAILKEDKEYWYQSSQRWMGAAIFYLKAL